MSQYFYGVCHTCQTMKEVSNVSLTHAEEQGNLWAKEYGHYQHNFEVISEYWDTYDEIFGKYKKEEESFSG